MLLFMLFGIADELHDRGVVATGLTDFVNPKRDALVASTALGRIGQAEEIAKANLFLLSDVSSFMTASVSRKIPDIMSSQVRACQANTLTGLEC